MSRRLPLLAVFALFAGLSSASAQVVYTQPGPVVVQRPGVVVQAPVVVGYNAYQDALGRLRSKHPNSRRDGAVTLGQIGDPRAVPDLVWVLRNDRFPEVRTAAAFALGAIGDPRAANVLRVAAMSDNNRQVRQAAAHAHGKITFAAPVALPATVTTVVPAVAPAPEIVVTPSAAWPPSAVPLEPLPPVVRPR